MPHDDDTPPLTPAGVMRLAADHLEELGYAGNCSVGMYSEPTLSLHPPTPEQARFWINRYRNGGYLFSLHESTEGSTFWADLRSDDLTVRVFFKDEWGPFLMEQVPA